MFKNRRQIILSAIILIVALGFGMTIGAVTWIIQDTPDISNYKGTSEATLIYGADGQLLTKLYNQNRIYVNMDRIPRELQEAIVAIEDTNFFVHHGIDFWGIGRAVITNILNPGDRPQGASTITQQLAGNALLNRQNISYYRKIQEAYLAMQFERLYTKPEILEMYLNEIFLGHSAYGVEAAAQQYFDKHVWELDLSESATIAGITRGPNYYSPLRNYDRAIYRRNIVLNRMLELGYITEEEAKKAKEEKLKVKTSQPKEDVAPYFIRYVRDQLIDRFGAQMVYSGGLKVYTTLDIDMQKKAENAIEKAIKEKYIPTAKRNDTASKLQPQLAMITIDPTNGEIRAMVGGRGDDQFNRSVQAVRQPGSAFKPFVYTTAIKEGYSTGSVVNDMPILARTKQGEPAQIWPTNFEDTYRGFVTLRTALSDSINVAAVKVLEKVGVKDTIKTAEDMGITTFQPEDRNSDHLSLALGGLNKGVTPLEMASAYGVFANQGIWITPTAITRVLDKHDEVLYQSHPEKKLVLSDDVAYLMTSMLSSVITEGTGWRADLKRPVAGKTGTTNDYTDAWFVGFTPDLVTSVWIGEDNLNTMEYNQKDSKGNYLFPENGHGRIVSSSEAAQLWGDYMRSVVKGTPVSQFAVPGNIVTVNIDPVTGLLPNKYTERIRAEVFRKNNVPVKEDYLHQPVSTARVDKESGLLATDGCPDENITEYNYLVKSGIRIGPGEFRFGKTDANGRGIKGSYLVDPGEPVQVFDPSTGVPATSKTGEVLYQKLPEDQCDLHQPEESKLLDSIWDFFNKNF